jgi:5-methylcytosine-specific restriction enzyme subunit McrC
MPPVQVQVREHDTLVRGAHDPIWEAGRTALPPEAFDAIEALLLSPQYDLNPVALPTKVGRQNALKLTQWVGLLHAPDGTTVEILPKTHARAGERSQPGSLERSRALLLNMLSATDERFRIAPPAELQTSHMPLNEVVLRYVLEGVKAAMRRGIPHAYVPVQEERPGLRGRLDLPRQVRQPPYRAHLLHVTYDDFLPDRPETRLTRLSVERVLALSRADSSRRLARELLHTLDGVPVSRDIDRDFGAWRLERGNAHFAPLEALCRMVLYELNPLVGGENERAHALLFDMNRVYEAYVARLLRAQRPDWTVQTQVEGRSLGRTGTRAAFPVRPDLLITAGTQVIIADTKWKRLSLDRGPTYDVVNADAYQMLAYSEVFQQAQTTRELWLIYPRLAGFPAAVPAIDLVGTRTLRLITVDLCQETPVVLLPSLAGIAPLGE